MKRFISLITVFSITLSINSQISLDVWMKERKNRIDSLHYGIFFEDINHAADGGLYAELIRNRSFEPIIGITHFAKVQNSWEAYAIGNRF